MSFRCLGKLKDGSPCFNMCTSALWCANSVYKHKDDVKDLNNVKNDVKDNVNNQDINDKFNDGDDTQCYRNNSDLSLLPDRYVIIDAEYYDRSDFTHVLSVCHTPDNHKRKDLPRGNQKIIDVEDNPQSNIQKHLRGAVGWIQQVLQQDPNARIVIHCQQGRSRSATVAIAFVMAYLGKSYVSALHYVRWKRRQACLNYGFKKQLRKWYSELYKARLKYLEQALLSSTISSPVSLLTNPNKIYECIYSYTWE